MSDQDATPQAAPETPVPPAAIPPGSDAPEAPTAPPAPAPRRRTLVIVLTIVVVLVVGVGTAIGVTALLRALDPLDKFDGQTPPTVPALPPAPGEAAAPADGVPYESAEFGYRVVFPGDPQTESGAVPGTTVDLTMEVTSWTAADGSGRVSQAIQSPVSLDDPTVASTVFAGSIQGAVQGAGGAIAATDPEEVTVGGLSGLRSEVTTPTGDGAIIVTGSGSVVYVLLAFGGDDGDREAFFDSFALAG